MEKKMEFYYLGKGYKSNPPQGESFKAYKYKNTKTKEEKIYPIMNEDAKEVFIYGKGWKKIAKTKVIDVPVFDLNPNYWDEYREKYGDACLFYSLDGTSLYDQDCCSIPKHTEYRSIIATGAEKFTEFIIPFNRMVKIQHEVINEKYVPVIKPFIYRNMEDYIGRIIFKPAYSILYSWVTTTAQPDVINDDERMENLYTEYRTAMLKSKDEDYLEYEKLEDKKAKIVKILKESFYDNSPIAEKEYKRLCSERDKLENAISKVYNKATTAINKIVDDELHKDNDIFPTSVRDRVKYLFGEEVSSIYNSLVDNFLCDNDN